MLKLKLPFLENIPNDVIFVKEIYTGHLNPGEALSCKKYLMMIYFQFC